MNAAASHADLTVAAWPGLTPRLLIEAETTESLADYRRADGYRELADPESLLAQVDQAGLVGRGGAAFPMAVKLRTVREAKLRGRDTVLVANGEEGEPASVKDRWLLHHRPHLVLDGLRLAARIVGAAHAHVYVSDTGAARNIEAALAEIGAPDGLGGLTVSVRTVDPGYVAGEETAAVRAINGGPAKPSDKPPRPFLEGIGGLPTLVSNVETLANLPYIAAHGAAGYRSVGTDASRSRPLPAIVSLNLTQSLRYSALRPPGAGIGLAARRGGRPAASGRGRRARADALQFP